MLRQKKNIDQMIQYTNYKLCNKSSTSIMISCIIDIKSLACANFDEKLLKVEMKFLLRTIDRFKGILTITTAAVGFDQENNLFYFQ